MWSPIDSGAVGASSNPVVYFRWAEHLVVGLDDQYINVFRTDPDGEVIDAYSDGVIWEGQWSEEGNGADYVDFVQVLRKAAVRKKGRP